MADEGETESRSTASTVGVEGKEVPADASAPGVKKVGLDEAKRAVPEAFLVNPLPPLTWVGKDLSKWVLSIMAASIVVLVAYLVYMESCTKLASS
jgi:hypothetical protein